MTDPTTPTPPPASTPEIGATALGYPRIGRDRQLKRDLERYWRGEIAAEVLDRTAMAVRLGAIHTMASAGLDTIPVNTFSWYDHVLDTSFMVGAVPPRFAGISGEDRLAGFDAARYFAMARGTQGVAPLEMTKWFDTNYHYLVPEIGPETAFTLDPSKVLHELAEATDRGRAARPVVVGPWTYLALAKASGEAPEGFDPSSRLDDLVEVYVELLAHLRAAGAEWVQIDEPALARELDGAQQVTLARLLDRLTSVEDRPAILLATYFADPVEALRVIADSGVEGVGLDLVRGPVTPPQLPGLAGKRVLLGAVEGRNVWRTDLRSTLDGLRSWAAELPHVSVSTSCSLLHVPYSLRDEKCLDPALRETLAFADEKLAEVVVLQRGLVGGDAAVAEELVASDDLSARRDEVPGLVDGSTRRRTGSVTTADRARPDREDRAAAQAERLGLPPLPTTTIGSFPQTAEVRRARADLRSGRMTHEEYTETMRQQVREVVLLQEEIGLDVFVHGEPERNDMVQYFAEQLEGYAATAHGWVQSYGSRCVRPPILFGDVHRPTPMTVDWATFAQGLTDKPVKGMLTGPVTMLAWSFVRDDQPRSVTADQVALALRDEVTDLEAAGIAIVQVDEPALRELLPIRRAEQPDYLRWSVGAFRLSTAGAATSTQVHTHLCYSEFGEIIEAIDGLDADVTSVEAARSRMELLDDVAAHGFAGAIGPGVYDIHSPHVPEQTEVAELVHLALGSVPPERLWVNPDCGLKTRGYAEVEPALRAMVAAAREARASLLPA